VDHLPYLFACYTVVWAGVVVYVIQLARRHRALQRELEELRQLVAREPRK
jgi:CcmD family protein